MTLNEFAIFPYLQNFLKAFVVGWHQPLCVPSEKFAHKCLNSELYIYINRKTSEDAFVWREISNKNILQNPHVLYAVSLCYHYCNTHGMNNKQWKQGCFILFILQQKISFFNSITN